MLRVKWVKRQNVKIINLFNPWAFKKQQKDKVTEHGSVCENKEVL